MKHNGVYDPEGKYPNPMNNNRKYTSGYERKPGEEWYELEVYKFRDEFMEKLDKNQVLIVQAGTGTGKTVIVPKLCLHYLNYEGKILVTIPRTTLVKGAVFWQRITFDIPGDTNGDSIGYKFRGSDKLPFDGTDKTKLLFATDGAAVNIFKEDPSMSAYDIIIVDEVHERNVNIDIMLLMLKEALILNPKLKLLIMSASLPQGLFQKYFSDFTYDDFIVNALSNFGVEEKWIFKQDYIKGELPPAVFEFFKENIKKGMKNKKKILIFLTAMPGIIKLKNLINEAFPKFIVYAVSKEISKEDADEIDGDIPSEYDKMIIITTPVWESSKTIKNLEVVIDTGYEVSVTYNPMSMSAEINVSMVSKGQIKQRIGRVGRSLPGLYYPLYSKKTLKGLKENATAPLLDSNVISNIYGLNSLLEDKNYENLVTVVNNLIEPPKIETQEIYYKMLYNLDFYNRYSKTGTVNSEGEIALNSIAGDDFMLRRAIISGVKYRCSRETAYIISIINQKILIKDDLFYFKDDDIGYEKMISKFNHKYGELFSIYNVVKLYSEYKLLLEGDRLESFIIKNKINVNLMENLIDSAHSIYRNTKKFRSEIIEDNLENFSVDERVLYSLALSYFSNFAILNKTNGKYKNFYPVKQNDSLSLKNKMLMKKINFDRIFYINSTKAFGKTTVSMIVNLPEKIFRQLPMNLQEIFDM